VAKKNIRPALGDRHEKVALQGQEPDLDAPLPPLQRHTSPRVLARTEGWRITCGLCGKTSEVVSDGHGPSSPAAADVARPVGPTCKLPM